MMGFRFSPYDLGTLTSGSMRRALLTPLGEHCTAWAGHNYQLLGNVLVCGNCSARHDAVSRIRECTNFQGHIKKKSKLPSGDIFTWCRVCGDALNISETLRVNFAPRSS